MVDQDDGVAVGDEIVHHAGKPHDVRRMQTDRRLVEHIEDAGRAVAHCAGQLHPLALAGGERGRGAVKRQVAQSQIHQPFGGALECLADAFGHRAHFLRQTAGNTPYPLYQL